MLLSEISYKHIYKHTYIDIENVGKPMNLREIPRSDAGEVEAASDMEEQSETDAHPQLNGQSSSRHGHAFFFF